MQYGVGQGSSKRQAKYAAARAAIQILIPEMSQHIDSAADEKADTDLTALHPHVQSWGSLLRLYGSKSEKSSKEKNHEELEITRLQGKALHSRPNYAVLEKLRNEMRKLRERDESVVPIGNLLFTEDVPHTRDPTWTPWTSKW
ncbi:uncharacterized protein LOC123880473 [Maniola jurtina]|uniref:uncharacterized protein LOC123880473 n=1 Tax=Maniola jurtina TaxID=191418 RepID=UPI001E685E7D|nr:uncharacterized protein LOC123880473 [Maniola jurtina]